MHCKFQKFSRKIITPLPCLSLFKTVLGQKFLMVDQFSKFLLHIFGQSINFAREIFCIQLSFLENICEILLSETRNHTLVFEF